MWMTRCNILQHTTTYCNTIQHTLQHSFEKSQSQPKMSLTHCNTLQDTATHYSETDTLQHTATQCNTLRLTATHTTTHCNTHYDTLQRRSRGIAAPDSNLDEYAIQSRQVVSSPPPLHGATESHNGCVYKATNYRAHLRKETCVDVKLSTRRPNHIPIDLKSNLKEIQTCKYILHGKDEQDTLCVLVASLFLQTSHWL